MSGFLPLEIYVKQVTETTLRQCDVYQAKPHLAAPKTKL